MALFSISDLHLSLGDEDKPMDIFGEKWENYTVRLEENWNRDISGEDMVVLPGDFCWAMHMKDSKKDFEFLKRLNGIKILLKGNHDYWWDTLNKLKRFAAENEYNDILFLQNNSFMYNNTAICGTRWWQYADRDSSDKDKKIYQREFMRARLSLDDGMKNEPDNIIFFTHYPPFSSMGNIDENFMSLIKEYPVTDVIYGHLHGKAHKDAFVGEYNGINFDLVSCDYLEFAPKKLIV